MFELQFNKFFNHAYGDGLGRGEYLFPMIAMAWLYGRMTNVAHCANK